MDYVKPHIQEDWKAISLDGSAFDSSQFKALMESVDDIFWMRIKPYLRQVLEYNWNSFRIPPVVGIDDILKNLM